MERHISTKTFIFSRRGKLFLFKENQTLIFVAETGSGKTTQLDESITGVILGGAEIDRKANLNVLLLVSNSQSISIVTRPTFLLGWYEDAGTSRSHRQVLAYLPSEMKEAQLLEITNEGGPYQSKLEQLARQDDGGVVQRMTERVDDVENVADMDC
ncbi:hypothetical protein AgCh_024376 [Apium graveolens]